MANTKSAEKRTRQSIRHRDRNRAHLSKMRSAVKKLRAAVEGKDAQRAKELLAETVRLVDATAKKAVIHKNAAARTKSRLTRAVRSLQG